MHLFSVLDHVLWLQRCFFFFLIENTVKELHIYSTFVSSRMFEVTELACESSLLF